MGLQSPNFVGAGSHLEWPLTPKYVQRMPAGVIEWQEYPLATTGFNTANATDWTITNPDADTLRVVLDETTDTHSLDHTNVAGLFVVIPTPISSFAPPGVAGFSTYRSVAAFAVEWDWTPADCETMAISVGIIKLDGSSSITTSSTAHRFFRRTRINPTTAQSTIYDYATDNGGANQKSVSTTAVSADTIGVKFGCGALGRVNAIMSYDWKDASYNKQESNFGDLTANRGSGTFNPEETWDTGNDKIGAVDYYFFMGFSGTGTTAASAGPTNKIDVKKIRYFVHSIGDWYK